MPAGSSTTSEHPHMVLPGVVAIMRSLSLAASATAISVGVLVLIGWWQDIDVLKRVVPGLVAMNPASTIAFVSLGISLFLIARTPARAVASPLATALAALAALIGFSRLLAILGITDLHVDELLFPDRLAATTASGLPNRMAPNTALNFLLMGVALATIDRGFRRLRFPAQYLTVIAAMSSLLALMGYAYGVKSFYSIGSYIPMALHSAVTFMILGAGILCARPTRGIMAVVSSDSSGGVLARRLLPAILILPALLGWLRLVGQRARLFDTDFGLWLLVVLLMTVFAVLVGWNAKLLFHADANRASAEETLSYQATHDALTQLPNRRLFNEQLGTELGRAAMNGGGTAVLFLDLDQFKIINDSLGHVVGDELLVAAGRRITESIDDGDVAARLSGDEFTVLLPDVHSVERAVAVADRIERAFGAPFTLGPHEVFTTASIGIALSQPGGTAVDLIRHADIAMYQAKALGKARYAIFDPAMDTAARNRLELERDLRRAVQNGEFCVYYQPEVEIETGRLVGMEALVRWNHPTRGLLSPSEFISVAEETGLILPIGRFVLLEACRQAREWESSYPRDRALMISVNLSGKHFQQATLIDDVADVLASTGIDPAHVIIEITESIAMTGAESTIEILTKLKQLGVLLAIDDFGTGFSSLSYLRRFPVDLLKIDKSFVDGVALNAADTAIVQAVIALGHALGMTVIAEGVETIEQVAQLRALGSELGQGFYFAAPLSDDVKLGMPTLLTDNAPWSDDAPPRIPS